MFLKSLEIFGFKSFPDRVKIEFADGITALLGPNGCGKSNVVDAVKWALGEQASRALRADKMEDVIFNGTETRKQLNVAEVVLTISNEKGLLNLDLSELAIKRRLYRSGESEYFINNQPARLKDVRELFWDTGVGKVAYSVMEQGKIDQVLSSRPEERRYLFEEAAGITKFKVKRQEAERKLAKTEENMRQINGSLTEVKKQYETLKVQSEKTIKHRELKDKVFECELDIQLLRLKRCIDGLAAKNEEINAAKQKRDEIQKEIDGINGSLSENMDLVNEMQEMFSSHQQDIFKLEIERREKDNQLQIHAKRHAELKEKLNQLDVKIASAKDRIGELKEDIDEKSVSVYEFKKRCADIEKNAQEFENNIRISSHRITANQEHSKNLEAEIKILDERRALTEEKLRGITEDIVTELDKNLRAAGYSSKNRQELEASLNNILSRLKTLISGRRNIFSDFASLHEPSDGDVKDFSAKAVSSFDEINSLVSELDSCLENYKKSSAAFIDDFLAPEGIITKKRELDKSIIENREKIEQNRAEMARLQKENEELSVKIEEYRKTLEALRINKTQVQAQADNAESQIKLLERQLFSEENTLKDLEGEKFSEERQLEQVAEDRMELEGEINTIVRKGEKLAEELEKLEKDISKKNSVLSEKQKKLEKYNADMLKAQSILEKYHTDVITAESDIRNIKDYFRETHSREIMEFEEKMYTITANPMDLKAELADLKQKLASLGPVNYMAPEEFRETKERYDFLTKQISDLEKAQNDLKRITDEIKAESTELFLDTYNRIKKNFHNMFRRLFGGGRAEIRLTDPKNVLESGIDIFAQPTGKKLENIGLLSGGEKSMTAVALLFATYMVKPSPFCLLDEIDAALDEQNVIRFVTTLREFANVSQYIVITHNKKTVIGANSMLGVTMEESGVSKVIAIKLDNKAELLKNTAEYSDEKFVEEDVEPEKGVVIPPHPPKRIKKQDTQEPDTNGTNPAETENSGEKEQYAEQGIVHKEEIKPEKAQNGISGDSGAAAEYLPADKEAANDGTEKEAEIPEISESPDNETHSDFENIKPEETENTDKP